MQSINDAQLPSSDGPDLNDTHPTDVPQTCDIPQTSDAPQASDFTHAEKPFAPSATDTEAAENRLLAALMKAKSCEKTAEDAYVDAHEKVEGIKGKEVRNFACRHLASLSRSLTSVVELKLETANSLFEKTTIKEICREINGIIPNLVDAQVQEAVQNDGKEAQENYREAKRRVVVAMEEMASAKKLEKSETEASKDLEEKMGDEKTEGLKRALALVRDAEKELVKAEKAFEDFENNALAKAAEKRKACAKKAVEDYQEAEDKVTTAVEEMTKAIKALRDLQKQGCAEIVNKYHWQSAREERAKVASAEMLLGLLEETWEFADLKICGLSKEGSVKGNESPVKSNEGTVEGNERTVEGNEGPAEV